MKVIINADDCGFNPHVNQHIKGAIESGKITSTTIMANMEDLDGALDLYEKYHNSISFGVHLNLTEGVPIIASKTLLDFGYYSEEDGHLIFNGSRAESFHYKQLPKYIRDEIYKELSAQIERVKKDGARISHIDSHHHIHTSSSLFEIIAQLSKEYSIYKVRRIRNYVSNPLSFYGRQAWVILSKMHNPKYHFTDYFAIFREFFLNPSLKNIKYNESLELMIHPGHYMKSYQDEEMMMMDVEYPSNFELINYNDL